MNIYQKFNIFSTLNCENLKIIKNIRNVAKNALTKITKSLLKITKLRFKNSQINSKIIIIVIQNMIQRYWNPIFNRKTRFSAEILKVFIGSYFLAFFETNIRPLNIKSILDFKDTLTITRLVYVFSLCVLDFVKSKLSVWQGSVQPKYLTK